MDASLNPVKVQHPWCEFFDGTKNEPFYVNSETGEVTYSLEAVSNTATTTLRSQGELEVLNRTEAPNVEKNGVEQPSDPIASYDTATVYNNTAAYPTSLDAYQYYAAQIANSSAGAFAPQSPQNNGNKKKGAAVVDVMTYVRHDTPPTADELARPARQQTAAPDAGKVSYTEGRQDYNIWYDKYLTDRRTEMVNRRQDREPASTRCNPFLDAGWTRAHYDNESVERPRLCLFFAKGCCTLGKECKYFHRVPTVEDNSRLDMMHDIFGRERHAGHRDDMDGTGAFTSECKTLFVGDMLINRMEPDYLQRTETALWRHFSLWGTLDTIRVIPNKNIAFVKYKYRVAAEFAKVAMSNQYLGDSVDIDEQSIEEQRKLAKASNDPLMGCVSVRWAYADRNENAQMASEAEDSEQVKQAVQRRMQDLGYTGEEIACYKLWGRMPDSAVPHPRGSTVLSDIVAPYPEDRMVIPPEYAGGGAVNDDKEAEPPVPEVEETHVQDAAEIAGRFEEFQKVLERVPHIDTLQDSAFEVQI